MADLARNWEEGKLGILTVSEHKDGTLLVVDGQHRVLAAQKLGLGKKTVRCHVYRDLTLEEEAEKFLALNSSKNVTILDRFKAKLVAKNPESLEIIRILKRHGLKIAYTAPNRRQTGMVRAVGTIEALHKQGSEILNDVLKLLIETWGMKYSNFDRSILAGFGLFMSKFNGEVDQKSLVIKLSKFAGGASGLLGQARSWSDTTSMSITRAVAEIMRNVYNRGRRSKTLPAIDAV